ncbi:testis-expressed protein 36 [Erethizon dorsatum]
MAKGRRFKPSLDKDGSWFPHIGLTQKTPESLMSSVLKEPYCPKLIQQTEEKLPSIYKVREKQAESNNFPFSEHDNRHSLENSGCYLDSGLGRKKISPDKRQQVSRNFNLWACDFIPSCLDGISSNQIAYVYKEAMTVPNFKRFPKAYNKHVADSLQMVPVTHGLCVYVFGWFPPTLNKGWPFVTNNIAEVE